jgi:group I intron endonuclease
MALTETFLYVVTQLSTGRQYVGISARPLKRWSQHKSSAVRRPAGYFHKALRKYGPEDFRFEVVARFATRKEAEFAEQQWIADKKPEFNLTTGGEGTPNLQRGPCSEETRRKIAETLRGTPCTEERKEKLRLFWTGRARGPMLQETKDKIAAAKRGRPGVRLGSVVSEETKQKLRAANLGKVIPPEVREKMSQAHQRRLACR